MPTVARSRAKNDRIGTDEMCHPPREQQVVPLPLGGRDLGHDRHRLALVQLHVAILHQQSAQHPAHVALARRRLAPLLVLENPQALLALQHLERAVLVPGREQHVELALGHRRRELG